LNNKIQGGPEKMLLETTDSFIVINLCEPPYIHANNYKSVPL